MSRTLMSVDGTRIDEHTHINYSAKSLLACEHMKHKFYAVECELSSMNTNFHVGCLFVFISDFMKSKSCYKLEGFLDNEI